MTRTEKIRGKSKRARTDAVEATGAEEISTMEQPGGRLRQRRVLIVKSPPLRDSACQRAYDEVQLDKYSFPDFLFGDAPTNCAAAPVSFKH
jgi:hypothetical protein